LDREVTGYPLLKVFLVEHFVHPRDS
jgi:hypothetical protein